MKNYSFPEVDTPNAVCPHFGLQEDKDVEVGLKQKRIGRYRKKFVKKMISRQKIKL